MVSFRIFFWWAVVIFLLPVWLPLIMVLVLVNFLVFRGNPFFVQARGGLKGKKIYLIKLRSMTNQRDDSGKLLPDSERLNWYGLLLRKTSLDELPGLFNVLKFDITLIGPRPLIYDYVALYDSVQRRRLDVLPGITGWAQINGRNSISWDEKFNLDIWYVDNRSFWLDLKIVYLTIKKVLVRDGISAEGEVTMHKFTGSSRD